MSQSLAHNAPPAARIALPRAPVLVLDRHRLTALTTDGELARITADDARRLVAAEMPVVCHAPQIAAHLGLETLPAYDVLELFAFVHPGRFCVPTPRGVAHALHLLEPDSAEDQCLSLRDALRHLLTDLSAEAPAPAAGIAAMMGLYGTAEQGNGWPFAPFVLAALGRAGEPPGRGEIRAALRVWDKLPEWAMHAPEPPAGHHGVSAGEAADRLSQLLPPGREDRPQQRAYAASVAAAFAPRDDESEPHVVLAEAGTGTGKTLGYLAPATVWAEKNGGAVWVSTYTRNLQRQIEQELERLYPDEADRRRKIVTRKGRENYLCLLNVEDATQSPTLAHHERNAVALGLMLRWAAATGDGDLAGRDFPGWLPSVAGWQRVHALADRRGECIYSACPHFNKCFIEKSVRKSKRAQIVIANHALVMHQAALDNPLEALPQRYVFDEGHHLFDAADSAFASHLNGQETADLRRWLMGEEGGRKSRARGLKRRLEDMIETDDAARAEVEEIVEAARCLPAPDWRARLAAGTPKGTVEEFLQLCHRQVYARNEATHKSPYAIEAETLPPIPALPEAAAALARKLAQLRRPMMSLVARLNRRLAEETETLDADARERITYAAQSLRRRGEFMLAGWIAMLEDLAAGRAAEGMVDWLEVSRDNGRDSDTGFYRHAADPAALFAAALAPHLHGAAVTSATLRDTGAGDEWRMPLARSGLPRLTPRVSTASIASPFAYKDCTKVFVIQGIDKNSTPQVAGAMRALFMAAGGGALGIFTSIQRLRAVQAAMVKPLEESGYRLYAQHVDPLDAGTLIDIFRADENACLLGTDATRDGIDVPGRSLRLVVYDRVPWQRPTILHKARRAHFGGDYDDMLTRFKLKQSFGRLIRRAGDRGVFVMLDAAMPSRFSGAFPPDIEIERVDLSDALEKITAFLKG